MVNISQRNSSKRGNKRKTTRRMGKPSSQKTHTGFYRPTSGTGCRLPVSVPSENCLALPLTPPVLSHLLPLEDHVDGWVDSMPSRGGHLMEAWPSRPACGTAAPGRAHRWALGGINPTTEVPRPLRDMGLLACPQDG